MQTFIHYFLHLGFPLLIAFLFFKKDWKKAYLIMILTMLVDVDHLFATPIFQPDRCSIQFHPLHTHYAMIVYAALLFVRSPFRIIGLGLLMHMATDMLDCVWMYQKCNTCLREAPALELIQYILTVLGA